MYEELNAVENTYNQLQMKRKAILMEHWNRKQHAMEALVEDRSRCFSEMCDLITSYGNQINAYSQFILCLKDLNTTIENTNNGKSALDCQSIKPMANLYSYFFQNWYFIVKYVYSMLKYVVFTIYLH